MQEGTLMDRNRARRADLSRAGNKGQKLDRDPQLHRVSV